MSRTVTETLMLTVVTALLAGCGLTQSASDATTAAARSIFYKQVKTLHLDISARTAMNNDTQDMNDLAVPTLVRVYQLRDSKAVERASYESLLGDDDNLLRSDLLDTRALVIKPGRARN